MSTTNTSAVGTALTMTTTASSSDAKAEKKKRKRAHKEPKPFQTVEEMERQLRESLTRERLEILDQRDRKEVYAWFKTLVKAEEFNRKNHNSTLPIFACNYPKDDSCFFVVSSYESLWQELQIREGEARAALPRKVAETATAAQLRHTWNFYEQLDARNSCHGYLDIEIIRECNADRLRAQGGPRALVRRFMQEIREYLEELGHIETGTDLGENKAFKYIVLEASNEKKVSYHVHFTVRNRRFKNNLHVGAFVRSMMVRMQDKYGVDPDGNPFFIRVPEDKYKGKGSRSYFEPLVDCAVYTRNRNFRMMFCTKTSGFRPLVPIDINRDAEDDYNDQMAPRKDLWLDSILQRLTSDEIQTLGFKLICCKDPVHPELEPNGTSNIWDFRKDLVKSQINANKRQATVGGGGAPFGPKLVNQAMLKVVDTDNPDPGLMTRLASALEKYWRREYDREGKNIRVQFFSINKKTDTVYFSSRSHYCILFGQAHTHNHVKFRLHLDTLQVEQSCMDGACERKQSYPMHLDTIDPETVRDVEAFIQKRIFARQTEAGGGLTQMMAKEAPLWLRDIFGVQQQQQKLKQK